MNRAARSSGVARILGVAAAATVLALLVWGALDGRSDGHAAQVAYLERCAADARDAAVCQRDIDTHGDECQRIAVHQSGVEGGVVSPTIYATCLELTPDGWRAREAESRRARQP